MPIPPPSRAAAPLTRRTALGAGLAGAGVVLVACTPSGIDRRPKAGATAGTSPRVRAGVDPDVALAATVLADEQALLDRVDATIARHPDLEATLASARTAHQAHVDLLQDAVPDDARVQADGAGPSVSPSVSPSVAASPTTPRVPARAPVALRAVATAEDRLALVGRRSAFAAESGAFARVLASMAAAAAQQAVTLAAAATVRG